CGRGLATRLFRTACHWRGRLSLGRLRGLARRLLDLLPGRRLGGLTRLLFGGLASLLLAPPRFLGGRQDGDRLLLAALRLALRCLALLLDQRSLAGGGLGRGQRP